MKFYSIFDPEFNEFGKVLEEDFTELIEALKKTPCSDNVVYKPTEELLENVKIRDVLEREYFAGYPIQVGYCNGHSNTLNALEYHKSSEINVAETDTVLLFGREQDIINGKYDTKNVKAFILPAGKGIEMYATTLHYAPCGYKGNGYRVVIVLPKGTNYAKPNNVKDPLVWGINKWLLAHPDSPEAKEGAYVGLIGENICLKDKI